MLKKKKSVAMTIAQDLSSILTGDIVIVGLKWIISFLVFYITSSTFLLVLIIRNNWGHPMNLKIGMSGVQITIAQHPSGKTRSDPEETPEKKKEKEEADHDAKGGKGAG